MEERPRVTPERSWYSWGIPSASKCSGRAGPPTLGVVDVGVPGDPASPEGLETEGPELVGGLPGQKGDVVRIVTVDAGRDVRAVWSHKDEGRHSLLVDPSVEARDGNATRKRILIALLPV